MGKFLMNSVNVNSESRNGLTLHEGSMSGLVGTHDGQILSRAKI